MWYVIQVRAGSEENIRLQCQRNIQNSLVLERVFIPYYQNKKRIHGEWTLEQGVLFPGYVFLISDQLDQLYQELKHVNGLTRLIGAGKDIIPLTDTEIAFLLRFAGMKQIVGISEGIIEGDQIKVHSGPLVGMEGSIRRIDRHKRRAWVELQMFGHPQVIQVSLEIIAKTAKEAIAGKVEARNAKTREGKTGNTEKRKENSREEHRAMRNVWA